MKTEPFYAFIERTLIRVSGADRLRVINNFFTNAILDLEKGHGIEGFFPNAKGRINGHGFVFIDDDAIWIEGSAGQAAAISGLIEKHVITEDIEFEDWSDRFLVALVSGDIQAEPLPPGVRRFFNHLDPETESGFLQFNATFLSDDTCIGYHCQTGPEREVYLDAAREKGFQIKTAEELERLRIMRGIPQFGIDVTDRNFPQELGRDEETISFTKGCYLGQETIARIDSLGHVNQKIVAVEVTTAAAPQLPMTVKQAGKTIGQITSLAPAEPADSTTSYHGIATLRVPYHKSGTRIELESGTVTMK